MLENRLHQKCVHIYKYIQMHVYIFMHTHTYIHLYMNFILNAQIIRTLICCPYNFYTNTHIHIWIKVNIDTHTYVRVFRDQQHKIRQNYIYGRNNVLASSHYIDKLWKRNKIYFTFIPMGMESKLNFLYF